MLKNFYNPKNKKNYSGNEQNLDRRHQGETRQQNADKKTKDKNGDRARTAHIFQKR